MSMGRYSALDSAGPAEPESATKHTRRLRQRAALLTIVLVVISVVVAVVVSRSSSKTSASRPPPPPSSGAPSPDDRPGLPTTGPVKKVVVLMLENRSYDQLLGLVNLPGADGITGSETLPINVSDPSQGVYHLNRSPDFYPPCNPTHTLRGVREQQFGDPDAPEPGPSPSPNNGHVQEALKTWGEECARFTFSAYEDGALPAFHALAKEFAVFDRYFCSHPGRTVPNRMFALSGTSHGEFIENAQRIANEGYPQRTFLQDLSADGLSWKVYYRQMPFTLVFSQLRPLDTVIEHFRGFDEFYKDAERGELPAFTWLEPRYQSTATDRADDMRPGNKEDIKRGDLLVKRIYEALRASPDWEDTLFVITFDEHGGLWDHVSPPNRNVPLPDEHSALENGMARLGPRIPVLMASPRIRRGTVVHKPSGQEGELEHGSLLKTIRNWWNMTSPPLTAREAWAATFEEVINLEKPRQDTPERLPTAVLEPLRPVQPVPSMWLPYAFISRPAH